MNSRIHRVGSGLLLLVLGGGIASGHPGAGPERGPGWEEAVVLVYARADFRGPALEFFPGDEVPNFSQLRFPDGSRANDRVMSVRVVGRASVLLFEDSGFRGNVLRATGDWRNLSQRFLPESPNHWGNRISSLRVDREGRGSRPGNLSAREAERVVQEAYRAVLDREVDPVGRRSYTQRIVEQGWTAAMVEDALRASEEYRGARVDRFIHSAYQDVLRREADAAGLAHYRRLILERGWDVERIKRDLRKSAEFRRWPAVEPSALVTPSEPAER
jgi:hypothetical protein